MECKLNKDDKIIGLKLGENNIWYLVLVDSKTGTRYMIERQKYIDSLYEEKL